MFWGGWILPNLAPRRTIARWGPKGPQKPIFGTFLRFEVFQTHNCPMLLVIELAKFDEIMTLRQRKNATKTNRPVFTGSPPFKDSRCLSFRFRNDCMLNLKTTNSCNWNCAGALLPVNVLLLKATGNCDCNAKFKSRSPDICMYLQSLNTPLRNDYIYIYI